MRRLPARRSFGRWLLLLVAALAELALVRPAWAAPGEKRVLVVYSSRRDAQVVVVGERELPRIFEAGLPAGVDYYSEYIDRARFPEPAYKRAFVDFLRQKYSGVRFDLIIAMQDSALEFLGEHRDELFHDVPIVFFASDPATRRPPNSAGLIVPLNFGGTLALAAQLQPETRHVFVVVGGDVRDKEYEGPAREQFRPFEGRFSFTYLVGLATRDLEARLGTLPERSIVFYLVVNRDGAGQAVHPLNYLKRVAAAANAPTYSWVDSAMDFDVVGGHLKDQKAQTEAIGQLALRVLRGERADSIRTSPPGLYVSQVDWRQLRRWGISEARVPAGAIVRFRQPSVWELYKGYILGAIALLLAQTVLIAGLFVQSSRRRQAEEATRDSQAELRKSYERIRDLGARLLGAQETERSRIARELHDDIGQQLALLMIDLELLGGASQVPNDALASEALNRAHAVASSVHDLSHRMHPAKLRLIGLVAALHGLQHELSRADFTITVTHDAVPPTLSSDLTLCLFRIVQEALQNAVKHSGAHEVSVNLSCGSEVLALTVVDDGVGFDVNAAWGKGLGLVSMAERLEAIGGTFKIYSQPGAGTRLTATAPVSGGQHAETVVQNVQTVAQNAETAAAG